MIDRLTETANLKATSMAKKAREKSLIVEKLFCNYQRDKKKKKKKEEREVTEGVKTDRRRLVEKSRTNRWMKDE